MQEEEEEEEEELNQRSQEVRPTRYRVGPARVAGR